MSKFASLILAVSFSFFLFVGMTYLIKPKALDMSDTEPGPPITVTFEVVDEEPKDKDRIPPKPVIQSAPETVATITDRSKPTKDSFQINRVAFVPNKGINGLAGISFGSQSGDGDAQPTVRINPVYPREAQVKGIEGFVTLRFDISELGRPINVSVIKSSPRGIFEKQARRALKKWKYNPKMVDKKAVIQINQSVTLAFEFEKESGLL
jgi:protein TonB